ncbi:MAG TPA: hypothetical protein VGI26_05350 [Solirubrobacteraceae bacterium]
MAQASVCAFLVHASGRARFIQVNGNGNGTGQSASGLRTREESVELE